MLRCHVQWLAIWIHHLRNCRNAFLPFDKLLGQDRLFHKPAWGSRFALRNILQHKRFLLWDDYGPVEYAQATVQASTFLFLFTGQPVLFGRECWFPMAGMPHDGQARGFGSPWAVSAEDIATRNSRANIFTANQQVSLPCEILKLCLLTILSLTRYK